MSRHRARCSHAAAVLVLLIAVLLVGLGWALLEVHGDCVAGRIVGPWC